MAVVITATNIAKTFRDDHHALSVLKGISFEIEAGEIFVVLGPSGSGKSTILRILSGLEPSYEGAVAFAEGFSKSEMSFVFQQFALLPWLTVAENISLGLFARHVRREERFRKVNGELRQFGLETFAHAYPRELSGGMKQRVGIARALATDPKIMFMDEPFSELDSFIAEELRKELLEIWVKRRPTIVMVTHNVEEAVELGDRIAVLTARPGRIEKIIKNTLPRPREKRSEEFFRLEDELSRLVKP